MIHGFETLAIHAGQNPGPATGAAGTADIAARARVAHAAGARVVVDNTFASPYLQGPFELGADIVVHSTTKYCGGHSDVVGGALVVSDLALGEELAYHQNAMGGVAGPFDAWLTLRGLRTLALRMERHCDNAERVVEFLQGRSELSAGLHPRAPHPPCAPARPRHLPAPHR